MLASSTEHFRFPEDRWRFSPERAHSTASVSEWAFGQRILPRWTQKWMPSRRQTYQLDLTSHSGLLVGQTERGMTMSLLQLGSLAARHRWNVVLLDPQSTPTQAMLFQAATQAAGCQQIIQSSLERTSPSPIEDPLEATHTEDAMPQGGEAHQQALPSFFAPERSHGDACVHTETRALYIGVNVWSEPTAARRHARMLLAQVTKAISEQGPDAPRILLLLKHPELFLEQEELPPLFALLDQARGSLFAAARSIGDLEGVGSQITEQGSTLIVHRSSLLESLSSLLPSFHNGTLATLPDDECVILHAGQATHIRINPVELALPSSLCVANRQHLSTTEEGFR